MRLFRSTLVVALLLFAGIAGIAGIAAAGPGSAGPVYPNWHAAVQASGIDMQQPIELTPLNYRKGVALYRLVGLTTGETALARVALPFDPTAKPMERPEPGHIDEESCAPGSPRCDAPSGFFSSDSSRCTVNLYRDVNFQGANSATNVDWNTFSDVPGAVNDTASSLRTTCAPVYFFINANWLGGALYLPANSSIADLQTVNFNDKISSLWHVLP